MNIVTSITELLTVQSPLLGLSAAQTAVVLLLAGAGAFFAGQLTGKLVKSVYARFAS